MKNLVIIAFMLFLATSCATTDRKTREEDCVVKMMKEDSPPIKAIIICREIYTRGPDQMSYNPSK